MRPVVVLVMLAWAPLPLGVAQELAPVPPMPSPVAPAARSARSARAADASRPPTGPMIRLGEKAETDTPYSEGAGFIEEGEFTVSTEGGHLSAVLNTAAYSHSFYGVHSVSVASTRLVQEFEVVAGGPRQSMVAVSLAAKLRGTVRAERNEKATCALRVASAGIAVPGGSTFLSLGFPPFARSGPVSERYEGETSAGTVLLAPGRYVLVADLVAETSVDSCLRGHAELLFAPPAEEGTWKSAITSPPKPKKGEEHRYGLIIVVTATPAER